MAKNYYLICGDRYWKNKDLIWRFMGIVPDNWVLLEGECPAGGADIIARNLAIDNGKPFKKVPAKWKKYGKKAGPMRNTIMVNHGPKFGLAFHNYIDKSKGTKDTVVKLNRKRIPVFIITETTPEYAIESYIIRIHNIMAKY